MNTLLKITFCVILVIAYSNAKYLLVQVDGPGGKVDGAGASIGYRSVDPCDIYPPIPNDPHPECSDCFPGSSVVSMENGERRRMSDLRVGDSVMAVNTHGKLVFSPIILYLHKESAKRSEFLVIQTNTNQSISLSHTHLIYTKHQKKKNQAISMQKTNDVGHLKDEFNPDFAENVKKGDWVIFYDSTHGLAPSMVVSVEKVVEKGVYSPLTSEGNIVVDGILASCYADFDNHNLQHLAWAPFRWWKKTSGFSSSTKTEQDKQSKEQDGSGVHWYAQGLHSFAKAILPWKVKQ